ncbi:ATP-binding protein [Jatrophihabitans fulvus]
MPDHTADGSGWRRYGRLLVERAALEASRGPLPGAALSGEDVRQLLGRPAIEPGPSSHDVRTAFEGPLAEAWQELLDDVDPDVGLGRITSACDLDDVEVAVLALLGAVELDPGLARLCALANGDPTRAFVTAGLVRDAIGGAALAALAPGGALRGAALVDVDLDAPLTSARVRVPRVVAWALADVPSADLPAGCELLAAPDTDRDDPPRRVLVAGPDRVRRLQAAAACSQLGLLAAPLPADDATWTSLVRHASVTGLDVALELDRPGDLDAQARRWIERAAHLGWALLCEEPIAIGSLTAERWLDVTPEPAQATPTEWGAVFGDAPEPGRRLDAGMLRLASLVASDGSPQDAVRRVAVGALGQHARRVEPRMSWDELILPESHSSRLRDLVDRYRHRHTVHHEWGLPLYPSPGVTALFSGPSGTGKSTAAEIIAHELHIGMYRVDLSALVSKYVGETEKNLEELFSAAHAGDYLLLFDEADSLFGVRSNVSDAKDRYANMEVSYLLQRLETYDGFVVLTSNFPGNIDPAFLRRIHVSLHFPVPVAADRRRMWDRSLGRAPLDAALDLDAVAQKYDLTGGSIRNAALSAAFLAASAGTPVGTEHVLRAVTQEMTKLGRRTTEPAGSR